MKDCFFVKIFLMILAIGALFSCSHNKEELDVVSYADTLKSQTEEKSFQINWTESIDGYIFDKTDSSKDDKKKQSEKSVLLPEGLFLGTNTKNIDKIFPAIKDFGSLDVREIQKNEFDLIKKFVDAINEKKITEDLFVPESFYYSFIIESEISSWNKIVDYIIGTPYKGWISEDEGLEIFEVPVRLFFESEYIDLILDFQNSELKNSELQNTELQNDELKNTELQNATEDAKVFSYLIEQVRFGEIREKAQNE